LFTFLESYSGCKDGLYDSIEWEEIIIEKRVKTKFNLYFFFILAHTILSISIYFAEGYKYVISLSLPASSGELTKEIKPIWDKMMLMNNINQHLSSIVGITAFILLLYFMYTLGTKNSIAIKKYLLSTTIYLILMIILAVIAHNTKFIPYGNALLLFISGLPYILLIIIIGSIRQGLMKLRERNITHYE